MITAAKNPPGEWLVWQLVRSALAGHFAFVHVHVHGSPDDAAGALPTIYYATHASWWDGYLCMAVARLVTHRPSYLMMEEKNLRRYRFFAWAGAFGIDRDDARAAMASLEYAASLLSADADRALFVFPQGVIVPNDRRPLRFHSGIAHLVRRLPAVRLVPLALRYEFLQEQRPEAFASIGPARVVHGAEAPRPHALAAGLADALAAEMDALRDDVLAERFADFQTILRGRRGIDRAFDRAISHRRL
jgi:chlorobactene lauroyltransferase